MRRFVKLAHHIHVLAHLCMERCIQTCLLGPLGHRQFPEAFELPTWTEEQRTILAFWRLFFYNQLKIEGLKGSLKWSPNELQRLASEVAYHQFLSHVQTYQVLMALFFLEQLGLPELSRGPSESLSPHPFQLPDLSERKEFGWICQPPPSSQAIIQTRQPANEPYEQDIVPRLSSPSPGPQETTERLGVIYDQQASRESSPEPQIEHENLPAEEAGFTRSDDGSDEDSDFDYDEDFQEDYTEDDESNSESVPDAHENSEPPDGLEIHHRRRPYVPHPVQCFGSQNSKQEEWQDLNREPLGLQIWRSMVSNPEAGPSKYMFFEAYLRYGFAICDEKRVVDFGLWSNSAQANPSKYFRRWFNFLGPEDIALYKQKFRYDDDDDYE